MSVVARRVLISQKEDLLQVQIPSQFAVFFRRRVRRNQGPSNLSFLVVRRATPLILAFRLDVVIEERKVFT